MINFFDISIWGNSIKSYIIALSIILLFIGAGQIFSQIIVGIIKKFAAKTKTTLDDIIIHILEKPLVFALFIAGFYYAGLYIIMSARNTEIYYNIIEILIVLNIIWAVMKFLDAIIEHYLNPLVSKSESQIDDQLLPFIRKFAKIVIVLIGAIFLIRHFGYDVTSLIAGLGIGGLAFALAAQPMLMNLFGGISIISDKPFKIGDRIKVDNTYEGNVVQIGMRSTTIKSPRSTVLHIPNSVIASTAVENLSRTKDNAVRTVFNIGVTYNTSSEKVKEAINIIKGILEEHPDVISDDPEFNYFVGFNEFKDSSLNIVVGYSYDSKFASKIRTEVNLAIKERFEKAGIEFAFPTQTVHVKND